MRVILGDVRPTEAVGYVAFATYEGKDDGDGVQRLRADRTYW
jgi:DMSO/TMAO reductase YedYZ molybdopterin-dependent catalytic subunit